MQFNRACFLTFAWTMFHGASLMLVYANIASRAFEYSFHRARDSRSMGLNFHSLRGSWLRARNRRSCKSSLISNQYLTRMTPSRRARSIRAPLTRTRQNPPLPAPLYQPQQDPPPLRRRCQYLIPPRSSQSLAPPPPPPVPPIPPPPPLPPRLTTLKTTTTRAPPPPPTPPTPPTPSSSSRSSLSSLYLSFLPPPTPPTTPPLPPPTYKRHEASSAHPGAHHPPCRYNLAWTTACFGRQSTGSKRCHMPGTAWASWTSISHPPGICRCGWSLASATAASRSSASMML